MKKKTIVIEGSTFSNLAGFYEEMNRLFMQDQDWKMGHSLDALNDILYGGFGVFEPGEQVLVIWKNFTQSKLALGREQTVELYQRKIEIGYPYNVKLFEEKLQEIEKEDGPLLWHIVLDIFGDHPNIDLILED
ncbi:ribonuclease inhibitor [Dyadobacter luteus]|uniref:Ribonuclease inhibitor n=1 Tax=Dyadobacter luteus TaxID=2259619 RepID=A0A3D8Y8N9_9BACT|nr:barstar family protein [Dyadobacter luteus]REA59678.1 ribonuclease inhibitor [Dyadobacter luteus]